MPGPLSILYLAPTFLSDRRHKPLRGVQVFDLLLVRQLLELGHAVTVPAEHTWTERFTEHWRGLHPRLVYTPSLRKPILNGLAAALCLRRPGPNPFDATCLGNPARGIVPMIRILRARGIVDHIVLQANKAPSPAFCSALRRWNTTITAVSKHVADQFPADLRSRVRISYGIANSELFHPPPPESPRNDALVRFCLVGKLDNAWKGAAIARAAFAALPPDVRAFTRLHLASYQGPPPINDDPCVIVEPWMKPDAVPTFLRRMDAMLVPSFGPEETFSQAMVQGMLTGLPILSSDLPVLAEKLDAGGGLVCHDAASFAHAITRLARDPALRASMGVQARDIALERYVWSTPAFVADFLAPRAVTP